MQLRLLLAGHHLVLPACAVQWCHASGNTMLVSLLQPPPECYLQFDDVLVCMPATSLQLPAAHTCSGSLPARCSCSLRALCSTMALCWRWVGLAPCLCLQQPAHTVVLPALPRLCPS